METRNNRDSAGVRRPGGARAGGAVRRLSGVPDEGAVLCAVRLRLQPADRLRRPAVVRARHVLRLRRLHLRLHGEGAGLADGSRHSRRHGRGRGHGTGGGRDRHPPAGHLFRDGHAGAVADGVLLLPAGQVHRRRGRHPGHPASAAVRRAEPDQRLRVLLRGAGHLLHRLPDHLAHHPLAVRAGAESHPRERATRHLARLRRRPLQADRLRAVGSAWRAWPAPPRPSCSSSPRSPTSPGRCRARWC